MKSLKHVLLALSLFTGLTAASATASGTDSAPLRFISIDGGGMLGLVPITLLEEIEAKTGRPIIELIDGMMGSSTGGIVAAMLNTPKQQWDATPKFTAADIHSSYVENAMKVFSLQAFTNALFYLTGLSHYADFPRAAASFEELLEENVGHLYLSHSTKRLMITSYNSRLRQLQTFDSERAKASPDHDMPLKQAIRATTALEFFFGEGTIKFNTTEPKTEWIDAGRFGYNDPTAYLCDALRRDYPGRQIVVYSLGTGFGTSYRTRAYMNGLSPNIEVVRIEPNLDDRKDGYVRSLLRYFAKSDDMAAVFDANYLASVPLSSYIRYIEEKAKSTLESPGFQRMLSELEN